MAYRCQAATEVTYNLTLIALHCKKYDDCCILEVGCFSIPVVAFNKIANHLHAGTARRHTNNNSNTHSWVKGIFRKKDNHTDKFNVYSYFQASYYGWLYLGYIGYILSVKYTTFVWTFLIILHHRHGLSLHPHVCLSLTHYKCLLSYLHLDSNCTGKCKWCDHS